METNLNHHYPFKFFDKILGFLRMRGNPYFVQEIMIYFIIKRGSSLRKVHSRVGHIHGNRILYINFLNFKEMIKKNRKIYRVVVGKKDAG